MFCSIVQEKIVRSLNVCVCLIESANLTRMHPLSSEAKMSHDSYGEVTPALSPS